MDNNTSRKRLSPREREVLLLIAYEYTNTEISEKLFLSKGTIATYRNNILSKLSANNTAGIVRIAFEKGILVLDEHQKIKLATEEVTTKEHQNGKSNDQHII